MSTSKIESIFTKAQDALVLQNSDLSLKSVSDMVSSGSIDISPKYQRRERWDEEKESGLIESFLLNIPVPPIYLAEDHYGVYSVIDGKQRLSAINKFLNNDLRLKNLEKFHLLEGLNFSELPPSLANALSIRPYLRVVTLLRQSDPDLKHEVFLRLNKAGVSLNSQEIRNVAFRGEFNDALFELSENPFLKEMLKAISGSKNYREMVDVQYVLRFFTVRFFWDSFPGNMDKAMDELMFKFHKSTGDVVDEMKSHFTRSIDFCNAVWGDDAFKRLDSSRRVIQGMYDVQMVSPSLLSEDEYSNAIGKPERVRESLLHELNTSAVFLNSVTQFTSNADNVNYRIERFRDILKSL